MPRGERQSWLGVSIPPELSLGTFRDYQRLVHAETGIYLSANKASLLVSRAAPRLRARGCTSMEAYLRVLLASPPGDGELQLFVNRMTTNKTDFFRENHHYDLIERHAQAHLATQTSGSFRVWSVGCSSGEEAYSAVICLLEAGLDPGSFEVIASDIDTERLKACREGVYASQRLGGLDVGRRSKWFLRGRGRQSGRLKVKPVLSSHVLVERLNLVDPEWRPRGMFDVVFCRNTLIYFDRETQRRVVERLLAGVRPGGLLLLGHSENLLATGFELDPVGMTAFRKSTEPGTEPISTLLPERPLSARVDVGTRFCAIKPAVVRANAESAVCVCMRDPKAGIGGVALLLSDGESSPRCLGQSGRASVHALEVMVDEIVRHGGRRGRIETKMFGGCVSSGHSPTMTRATKVTHVSIRAFLERESLPVLVDRTGLVQGVQIRYETATGRAFAKALGAVSLRRTRRAESACLATDDQAGDAHDPGESRSP